MRLERFSSCLFVSEPHVSQTASDLLFVMLTRPKRPRTQSSESNETGPAKKLTRLKEVDESGDRIEDPPQVIHSAAAVRTAQIKLSSLTLTCLRGRHSMPPAHQGWWR